MDNIKTSYYTTTQQVHDITEQRFVHLFSFSQRENVQQNLFKYFSFSIH